MSILTLSTIEIEELATSDSEFLDGKYIKNFTEVDLNKLPLGYYMVIYDYELIAKREYLIYDAYEHKIRSVDEKVDLLKDMSVTFQNDGLMLEYYNDKGKISKTEYIYYTTIYIQKGDSAIPALVNNTLDTGKKIVKSGVDILGSLASGAGTVYREIKNIGMFLALFLAGSLIYALIPRRN